MGKIRVKTLGIEEVENKQKQKARVASEAKRAHKKAEQKKLVKGAKGGERLVAVGPTEEELARLETQDVSKETKVSKVSKGEKESPKKKTQQTKRVRGKKYQTVAKLVDKTKTYSLQEALTLLPKLHLSSFDETVELHINTIEKGIAATATFPHGTGKTVKVAIANPSKSSGQAKLDELITKIGSGNIDFDVLLATPDAMQKLARVAKYLGPRGLMPNPKNGTITNNPKELAKKFEEGQTTFKTEAKSPIMHIIVGKLSFGQDKLTENIKAVLNAVKAQNIKNVTLKSTMSPGIKIQLV